MGMGWLSGWLLWAGWERKAVGVRVVFIASSLGIRGVRIGGSHEKVSHPNLPRVRVAMR